MANMKQCDRCGKVFPYDPSTKPNAINIFKRNTSDFRVTPGIERDLCPECLNKLEQFLDNKVTDS